MGRVRTLRRHKGGIRRPGEENYEEQQLEGNPNRKNNETVACEGVGRLKEREEQTHGGKNLQQGSIECHWVP